MQSLGWAGSVPAYEGIHHNVVVLQDVGQIEATNVVIWYASWSCQS